MSVQAIQLGHHAANTNRRDVDQEVEAEYDRLRALARQENEKRKSCSEKSRAAYDRSDHETAKRESEKGKRHADMVKEYNRQASEYIFRENNALDRVDADCIDLHGQYVEEAEDLLERRIRADRASGQSHLHVITGQGHHSADHAQKLRPRVGQLCDELGLRYETEENAGRIYIDLVGTGAGHGKPGRPGRPERPERHRPPHRPQQPPESQPDDIFGSIFHKLEKICCAVM